MCENGGCVFLPTDTQIGLRHLGKETQDSAGARRAENRAGRREGNAALNPRHLF